MCDTLVALASAAANGVTLFAKNSDRPPQESQVIEWSMPRVEAFTRATHISIEGAAEATIRSVICRPSWCWGAEQGVNEAGVAIGNEAIYTTLDPRSAQAALIGMDLVRLGLERAPSAHDAVQVMTTLSSATGRVARATMRRSSAKTGPTGRAFSSPIQPMRGSLRPAATNGRPNRLPMSQQSQTAHVLHRSTQRIVIVSNPSSGSSILASTRRVRCSPSSPSREPRSRHICAHTTRVLNPDGACACTLMASRSQHRRSSPSCRLVRRLPP